MMMSWRGVAFGELYLFVTLCVTWFVSKVARNSFSNRHETFRRDGTVQNNKTFGYVTSDQVNSAWPSLADKHVMYRY